MKVDLVVRMDNDIAHAQGTALVAMTRTATGAYALMLRGEGMHVPEVIAALMDTLERSRPATWKAALALRGGVLGTKTILRSDRS